MIKFFRHTRQSLLMKNNPSKYLKYAIGEIVLVVIGILIALQINNWNENRKIRKQESNYYCQLVNNLRSDLSNIDLSIKSLDIRKETTQRFLKNLLKKQSSKDQLFQDWLGIVRSTGFVPTRAAIDDITSSGKLEIIANENHKNRILDHYVKQDLELNIITINEKQLNVQLYNHKDFTAFGIQEVPEFKIMYDKELQALLKSSEWHKNPDDSIFKHVMNYANFTIIYCGREKELLRAIEYRTHELINVIQGNCQNPKN